MWWVVLTWVIGSVILLCWMGYEDEDPFDDPNFFIVAGWPLIVIFGLVAVVPFSLYKLFQWLGWKVKGH